MALEDDIIDDTRGIFERYLAKTKSDKRIENLSNGRWLYPIETIEADMMVFSQLFSCLWMVFGEKAAFKSHQNASPDVFQELTVIVTKLVPTDEDRAFWSGSDFKRVSTIPFPAAAQYELARTLRNGLSHFNFRFENRSPRDYFARMGLPFPTDISKPDTTDNYRIFICDRTHGKTFMASDSNSRMVETGFAHLRYHLFRFLGKFFRRPGAHGYIDILTGELIA